MLDHVAGTVGIRYNPARFAYDECTSRHVPRRQFQLPEAVQTSESYVDEVQGR